MIQKPVIFARANLDEAHANAIDLDESTLRRIERCQKALASALCVKASNVFQTLAHRGNANVDEGVGIGWICGSEARIHR